MISLWPKRFWQISFRQGATWGISIQQRCDRSAREIEKLARDSYDASLLDIDLNLSGSQLVAQLQERDLRLASAPVRILGTNLTGATSVTFNGTAAKYTVVSGSLISATVPAGVTTRNVQVVTPNAILTSNVPFRVAPSPEPSPLPML